MKRMAILLSLALVFTGCAAGSTEKKEETKTEVKTEQQTEQKVEKDDTTEVVGDTPELKEEDIEKIVKHGDHYHVYKKDGEEITVHEDLSVKFPNLLVEEDHEDHDHEHEEHEHEDKK